MITNILWDNDNVTQKSVIRAEGQSKEEELEKGASRALCRSKH